MVELALLISQPTLKMALMPKIGVLGAGHLGKIHLKLLQQIEQWELIGFYDPDAAKSLETAREMNLKAFDSPDALLEACEAVDIVTPTMNHFACAQMALERKMPFFVEKPLTNTVEEAALLVQKVKEAGVVAQVGHVERFNPAFQAATQFALAPKFIEGHRLSTYNPRGTDVSVVLDLMIHDLDIILSLIDAPVRHISASGVPVISDSPDIANARIEFENGAVANLTASRVSMKKMRKMRMFQRNAYITIDFLDREFQHIGIRELAGDEAPSEALLSTVLDPGDGKPRKEIVMQIPAVPEGNALKSELEAFHKAFSENTRPQVNIEDGFRSLELAHRILSTIEAQPFQV